MNIALNNNTVETLSSSIYDIAVLNESQMQRLGGIFAESIQSSNMWQSFRYGLQLHFSGSLGVGKTFLIRSLIHALGIQQRVKSPSYSLVETYELDDLQVIHADFYRIKESEEFELIGGRDLFQSGRIICIEWPERIDQYLPAANIGISIEGSGDQRTIRLTDYLEPNCDICQKVITLTSNLH